MRWTTNTTTIRERSRRASAARLQLAVGRRGLGPRDQEEQRNQRASFVAIVFIREYKALLRRPGRPPVVDSCDAQNVYSSIVVKDGGQAVYSARFFEAQ